MKVSRKEFGKIYQKHVQKVYSFWTEKMQQEIAKHNKGWGGKYDFSQYLIRSEKRFFLAYQAMDENIKTICDVGGFWGVFPLTLKELGYEVTMTEAKKYYSDSFDPLFKYVEQNGVKILDIDPFEEQFSKDQMYDYLTIMAVLEHFPNSLNFFLNNVFSILKSRGKVYIDVPNIAYAFKRLNLLKGKSPLPNILTIYDSATPFIGHNHEYTLYELRAILEKLNIKIIDEFLFNYSIDATNIKFILKNPIASIMMGLIKESKECIGILGEKS